jgi:hypothetical protein
MISQRDMRIILNSRMQLILKTNANRHRNNFFMNNEVIVIIINNKYDLFYKRDIIFMKRRDEIK